MDFDSAYIDPLVDGWLEQLHEAIKEEENMVRAEDEFYMPFIGIPASVISAIFKITCHLELGTDTKYLTIHLYDKFMCNYFWEVYKTENEATEASWSKICQTISHKSKLYLVSCLQLASKMDLHSKSLSISQLICILRWIDKKKEYTNNVLISSEFKVFKTIGFKMPFCTPLQCIEVLLAATGLRNTLNIYETSIELLDLAYLQHEQLYSHVQCLAQGRISKSEVNKRNLMALKTNSLFLGGCIILCATFFLYFDNNIAKGIAAKLADLVDTTYTDIWDVANILLILAIQE
ncbi:PREDICTED: cyclin N-terminal domain-containing protein 1-like isoform X1 [Polistes dominula]|uniref:Cyclin N-terminal domain-containing protein 1-like isoform X1 n=2 Tax=Polistes dominula TaxID=743375 RepID=A0ABM1J7N9_POLDO|nr:PREDICTED: cyclin N-terminal domain-containing protein 1-like isoform X1 [Polistes dominula]